MIRKVSCVVLIVFSSMLLYSCPISERGSDRIVPIITANHHDLYGDWKIKYQQSQFYPNSALEGTKFGIYADTGYFSIKNTYAYEEGGSGSDYYEFLQQVSDGYIYKVKSLDARYHLLEEQYAKIMKIDDKLYIYKNTNSNDVELSKAEFLYAEKIPIKL